MCAMSLPALAFDVKLESNLSAEPLPQMFSRDGKILVGVGAQTVKVWDAKTFTLLHSFDIGLPPLSEYSDGYAGIGRKSSVSPDGKSLLTIEGAYSQPKEDAGSFINQGKARLWDLATGRLRFTLARPGQKPEGDYYNAAFSPDGKIVAINGATFQGGYPTLLWETATGKFLRELPYSNHATSLFFSPDGKYLFGGNTGSQWLRWNVASGKMLGRMEEGFFDPNKITDAAGAAVVGISADNRVVIVRHVRRGKRAEKYSAARWKQKAEEREPPTNWSSPNDTLSPDGKTFLSVQGSAVHIAAAGSDKTLGILTTGLPLDASNSNFRFSSDGRRAMQFPRNGSGVLLWNLQSKVLERAWLQGDSYGTPEENGLRFSSDGKWLLSSGKGVPTLWNLKTKTLEKSFLESEGLEYLPIISPTFALDGQHLAGIIRKRNQANDDWLSRIVWQNLETNSTRAPVVPILPDAAWREGNGAVAFAETQNLLAVAKPDAVKIYDLKLDQMVRAVAARWTRALLFSPDGKTLVTFRGGNSDAVLRIWDVVTGKVLWDLPKEGEETGFSWAFTGDNRKLITNFGGQTMNVYDTQTGALDEAANARLRKYRDIFSTAVSDTAVAASSDGKLLAISSQNSSKAAIFFYDATDFHWIKTLSEGEPRANNLAFSPDGALLASQSSNGALKLWRITR